MPIADIQRTSPRLSRLGIIRLGVRKTKTNSQGKEVSYPTETEYFVLKDAPDLMAVYGEQPQQILIYLPHGSIDDNFPAFHENWMGGSCVCRGDGQQIIDLVDPGSGRKAVRDGRVVQEYRGDGAFHPGDVMPCPGLEHNLYPRCAKCKPSAILLAMVRDPNRPIQLVNDRLGYYQVRTHSFYNIQGLTGQLQYAAEVAGRMGRDLRGIPMILKRVPREISYTDNASGERKTTTKHLLDLEFDLAWVQMVNAKLHDLALGMGSRLELGDGSLDTEVQDVVDGVAEVEN